MSYVLSFDHLPAIISPFKAVRPLYTPQAVDESIQLQRTNYRHFANMFETLMALPQEQIYLTDEHMDQLGIRVKKLELDPEANPTSNDKPEYFAPLSRKKPEGFYKIHKPAFNLPA